MIREGKYNYIAEIYRELGVISAQFLMAYYSATVQDSLLVPVPLHTRKQRSRGFNQAAVLARSISEHMQVPWQSLLARKVYTQKQSGKHRVARQESMANIFMLNNKIAGRVPRKIVLVDDVFTTGATMRACTKVIQDTYDIPVLGLSFARA